MFLFRFKRQQISDDQINSGIEFNFPSTEFNQMNLSPTSEFQITTQATQIDMSQTIDNMNLNPTTQASTQLTQITTLPTNSNKKNQDSDESDSVEDVPVIKITTKMTTMPIQSLPIIQTIQATTTRNLILNIVTKPSKNESDSNEDD